MSVNVDFWAFSKKENSTAQPNAAYKTTYACTLKDSCGVLNPSIILDLGTSGNPASYNYAYISDFSRYYFVDEWTYERGYWIATMHVDVLSTYKTGIGLSTQYVLRAATPSSWDGSIIDTSYPTKGGVTINEEISSGLFGDGSYVVGVYGGDNLSIATGPITWYVMDQTNMTKFSKYLYSDDMYALTSEVVDKAIFNPLEYIAAAFWIPVSAPTSGTGLPVMFGWYQGPIGTGEDAPFTASRLSTPYTGPFYVDVDIPKHPQAASRGSFLNHSPYSRYTLYAGPFGVIPLESAELSTRDSIRLEITKMDFTTGCARFQVKVGSFTLYSSIEQLAVPIPLAQLAQSVAGLGSHLLVEATKGMKNTSATGWYALAEIAGVADNLMPKLSSFGSVGTTANVFNPFLSAEFLNIVPANDDHQGRPVCKELQLNTLGYVSGTSSGYIKCADGELAFSCTTQELLALKTYLTEGFFYE